MLYGYAYSIKMEACLHICDLFEENVPKVEKTTIEIRLNVSNNSTFNKYPKPIFS